MCAVRGTQFKDRHGERFLRMWRFYLLSCAGAFRARSLELFQFVFRKAACSAGYSAFAVRSASAL